MIKIFCIAFCGLPLLVLWWVYLKSFPFSLTNFSTVTIDFTHKDQKEIGRLGKQINQGLIPVEEVRDFFNGLQQKMEMSSAQPERRNAKKIDRKDKYRMKLKMAR
jgi:hypothetical protein